MMLRGLRGFGGGGRGRGALMRNVIQPRAFLSTESKPKTVSGGSTGPAAAPKGLTALAKNTLSGNNMKILGTFAKHLWPRDSKELRTRVVVSLGLLVGAKVVQIQIPWLFKQAIDTLNSTPPEMVAVVPTAILLSYGGARMTSALFSELRSSVFAKVAQSAIRKMSRNTFLHILNLDLPFHLSSQTGGLARVIDRGTKGINRVMQAMLFHIVPTILEIGMVGGIFAYSFGPEYLAWVLGTVGAYSVWTLGVTQWRTKFRKYMNRHETQANAKCVDSLINYETIRYFGNQEVEADRYEAAMKSYSTEALKVAHSLALLNFGQQAIFSVALAGTLLSSGHAVANGDMTIGDMVMINGLLFQLSMPLNFLGSVYRDLRQALVDMDNMFKLLHRNSTIVEKKDAPKFTLEPGSSARIKFDNVVFGYEKGRDILDGFNLDIEEGKTVALVGASGSGKSTILRLLFRFFDPAEGSVQVNGVDVRDVQLESFRSNMAVIPQDTVLFNDTIGYNIGYGKPGATQQDIEEAAKAASLDQAIRSWPEGYNTVVGERGLKLSGGEKQRVSIARAVLKDANLLLLDEATSAQDSQTEKNIVESFGRIFKGKTKIIIAHRLETIIGSDEIVVLEKGKVVEKGTHSELLKHGGVYGRLWEQQHTRLE